MSGNNENQQGSDNEGFQEVGRDGRPIRERAVREQARDNRNNRGRGTSHNRGPRRRGSSTSRGRGPGAGHGGGSRGREDSHGRESGPGSSNWRPTTGGSGAGGGQITDSRQTPNVSSGSQPHWSRGTQIPGNVSRGPAGGQIITDLRPGSQHSNVLMPTPQTASPIESIVGYGHHGGQIPDSRRGSHASNASRPFSRNNSPLHSMPHAMGRDGRRDSRGHNRWSATNSPTQAPVKDIFDGGAHNPGSLSTLEDRIVDESMGLVEKFKGFNVADNQPSSKKNLPEDTSPLPPRPGYGTGEEVPLWANYFEMNQLKNVVLFQHAAIPLEGTSRISVRARRRIFALLLQSDQLKKYTVATNYKDKLVSTEKLPQCNVVVRYYEEEDPSSSTGTYTVSISGACTEFHLRDLIDDLCLSTESMNRDHKNEAIQALNIVLAHLPNKTSGVQSVGQAKHFLLGSEKTDLGGGLNALRGFFHSARPSTGRMLLNLNVSTAAFYRDGSLRDLITAFGADYQWASDQKWAVLLNNFVRRLRVKTSHVKRDGRPAVKVRTILGMALDNNKLLDTAGKCMFFWREHPAGARNISVKDYFMQAYRIQIDQNEEVVDVGNAHSRVYLPVSACEVLPGQTARQTLSGEQTSQMIKVACRQPADNARDIVENGLRIMGIGQGNTSPGAFGIEVSRKMLAVNGMMLPAPQITYDGANVRIDSPGKWNLTSTKRFQQPGSRLSNGTIKVGYLVVNPPTDPKENNLFYQEVQRFMNAVSKTMAGHGIRWPGENHQYPRYEILERSARNTNAVEQKLAEARKNNVGFLVVILQKRDAEVYSRIKLRGDCTHGINTCCVVRSKRFGLNTSAGFVANIALKINLKLGGVNQQLTGPNKLDPDTMYIGIDVTHPTGLDSMKEAPSIAGVVANKDNLLGQWPASIRTQGHRVEIVEELTAMIKERVAAWKEPTPPKRVIVYRDGVSETQYEQVIRRELPQIHKALGATLKTKPPVTIVIVGKRHHTRFYPVKEKDALPNSNVKPGVVVDRGCTMERKFDFFMVAHAGLQGTSRPAHYVVVHDENKLSAGELQQMTYKLCYLYGRASRSVSIVPPAYYADILCERSRNYLYDVYHCKNNRDTYNALTSPWNQGVHADLANTMFYI